MATKTDSRKSILNTLTDAEEIFSFIADGGSLTAWCRSHKLKYSSLNALINSDDKIKTSYHPALSARDEWCKESVLAELRLIALTDVRRVLKSDGSVLPHENWPEEISRAISSIKVTEEFIGSGTDKRLTGYTKEIKLWDKQKALDSVAKVLGLLVDKPEVNVNISLQEILKEAVSYRPHVINKN